MRRETSGPTAVDRRDLLARHGGGGPLTRTLSQPAASVLGATYVRRGWSANSASLMAITISLAGSAAFAFGAELAVICGWLLWQSGYLFDCADGQIARYTNTTSEGGKRLDVTLDLIGHTAIGVSVGYVALERQADLLPVLAFVATRTLATTLASSVPRSGAKRTSLPSAAKGLVSDFPFQTSVIAVSCLLFESHALSVCLLLLLAIALGQAASAVRQSLRHSPAAGQA